MNHTITKNGYCLTLRERKIMILMLDEVEEMADSFTPLFRDKQLESIYEQIGIFVEAFNNRYLDRKELLICGE